MSSMLIKSEEIIVDPNEYNSDDLDEDLNMTFEDTGGEVYQQRVSYRKSIHQAPESMHGLTSPRFVSSQQHQRNEMNISAGTDQNIAGSKNNSSSSSTKNILESEKRIRREIANSNERRRMQSINAGFQNLRSLLPRHEGEKLSKAAILQQTSQYICDLENQKTQLLAQNSQLKRTLGQHELSVGGGYGGSGGGGGGGGNKTTDENCCAVKKRKLNDNIISLQTISDSSDEGLGSVSPEPTTLLQNAGNNTTSAAALGLAKTAHGNAYITHSAKELLELKKQLEKERRLRAVLQEDLRTIKRQLYNAREVIEHTDNINEENATISYVALNDKNEPSEVVVCSSIDDVNDECSEIISDETIHEEIIVSQQQQQQLMQQEEDIKYDTSTLQPILQAAIKAQPKVEVERICNETVMKINTERDLQKSIVIEKKGTTGLTRSRQNLETIVEAIRHLEGDHLFGESVAAQQKQKAQKSQESPLALTTKQLVSTVNVASSVGVGVATNSTSTATNGAATVQQRKTIAELSPFLQIKNPKLGSTNIVTIVRGRSISLAPTGGGDNNSLSISALANPSTIHQTQNTSAANNMLSSSSNNINNSSSSNSSTNNVTIPTSIVKVQSSTAVAPSSIPIVAPPSHITITTASLKQCRPGVIVAKQIS